MPDFRLPSTLAALAATAAATAEPAGLAVYIVGGSVRDVLLGRPMRDFDLAVDGDALAWARALALATAGHFVPLGETLAAARVVLDDGPVRSIDVAPLQGSLADDLRRRDLTIDALAVPLGTTQIIDVTGGLADLDARVVRMTSAASLDADPLRLLRAVRIAGELGWPIEAETAAAISARAARVLEASAERRRDELARIFALSSACAALRSLDALRLLDALLPEATLGRGVAQPKEHAYDVLEHGLRAVKAVDIILAESPPSSPRPWFWHDLWETFAWREMEIRAYFAEEMSEGRSRGALLKLAALLHDIAKPQTRSVGEDGRVRFFGHADEGAATAAKILRRYRFSAREQRFVSTLVAEHLRPVQLAQLGEAPTRRALYRLHRDAGDAVPALLFLALADAAAARGPALTRTGWARQVAYMNSLVVRSMEGKGIVVPPRLLTGHDIMSELGVPPGPHVGRLLEALAEAQAAGEVGDRETAVAFVRRHGRQPRTAESADR